MKNRLSRTSRNVRAASSLITSRGEGFYDDVFDVDAEDTILDLGAGLGGYDRQTVVGTDYKYKWPAFKPRKRRMNVACLFQELPFADESFDGAIANSSFEKLWDGSNQAVSESLRVVKPGGNLQVWPVALRRGKQSQAQELEERGLAEYRKDQRSLIGSLAVSLTVGGIMYAAGSGYDRYIQHGRIGLALLSFTMFFSILYKQMGTLKINRSEQMSDPTIRMRGVNDVTTCFAVTKKKEHIDPIEHTASDQSHPPTDRPYDWAADDSIAM